jgi:hypothetical protein
MRSRVPYNGIFVPRDYSASGHLAVAGKDSSLSLVGNAEWGERESEYHDIHGTLSDGRRASLLLCLEHNRTRHRFDERTQFETTFFPHYVVIGDSFIGSEDAVVGAVDYHFENVECLVDGHGTFSSLQPTPEQVRRVLKEDHEGHEEYAKRRGLPSAPFNPQLGDHPELLIFTGVWKVIECACEFGSVALVNRTSHGMGDSTGIGFKNEVVATIEFRPPRTVAGALEIVGALHCLFELALGHRQRYRWIDLRLASPAADPGSRRQVAELFWSNCNERAYEDTNQTSRRDVLLDPTRHPAEFSKVVAGWMNSRNTLGAPRYRFATGFFGSYDVNRIVSAANIFDLLPETHAPKRKKIDEQTRSAVAETRKIFRALPDSVARESVLDALGRVGTASLRDKVLHRAAIVAAASSERLPELNLSCAQAVLCRNHYVHGSKAGFDYRHHFTAFAFLVDTLEFIFAASDLIELGWDLDRWRSTGTSLSHHFGSYLHNYPESLRELKVALG